MIQITIEVEGMKCGMCESHVNDAVRRVSKVSKVSSSRVKSTTVVVASDDVNTDDILKAISAQGYRVGKLFSQPYKKRGLFGRNI